MANPPPPSKEQRAWNLLRTKGTGEEPKRDEPDLTLTRIQLEIMREQKELKEMISDPWDE